MVGWTVRKRLSLAPNRMKSRPALSPDAHGGVQRGSLKAAAADLGATGWTEDSCPTGRRIRGDANQSGLQRNSSFHTLQQGLYDHSSA